MTTIRDVLDTLAKCEALARQAREQLEGLQMVGCQHVDDQGFSMLVWLLDGSRACSRCHVVVDSGRS